MPPVRPTARQWRGKADGVERVDIQLLDVMSPRVALRLV